MRSLIGFLGFNGLALLLGSAMLYAAGFVRPRVWSLVPAAGAALLAGLAGITLVALFALLAGLGMGLPGTVAGSLLAGAVLVVIGRRRRAPADAVPARPSLGAIIVPGVVVAFAAIQLLSSRKVPVAWDAAHIWSLKAIALADWGRLEGRLFTDADGFTIAHLDYPLGWPVLGSLALRGAGTGQQGVLVGELWVILAATVLAVPWLVRPGRWTLLAFAPMLLAMVAAPSFGLLRGDADVPMACFLAAGAAAAGRALETDRARYAVLAALWLGLAANIKAEGLAFAAAVLVTAFAVALAGRRRAQILAAAAAGAAVLVLAAPWRLWIRAHGPFHNDVTSLSDSLNLHYLVDKLPQLDLGAQTMLGRIADPGSYWLVPALIALAVAGLARRRETPLAALYLGALVLSVLSVVWVYWTSQVVGVAGHIERTTLRTITGPLFIAAAGLAHLLPRLIGDVRLAAPVVAEPAEEPELVER